MKAVLLSKIEWDNKNIPEDILKNLPVCKGFIVKDDYDTASKTPVVLMKKYGCGVNSLKFSEFHIADNIEEFLLIGGRCQQKTKNVFKIDGSLTAYGKRCLMGIESLISQRLKLEFDKVPEEKMPNILNELVLSFMSVTGKSWEKKSCKELMGEIKKLLKEKTYKNLKDDSEIDEDNYDEDEE